MTGGAVPEFWIGAKHFLQLSKSLKALMTVHAIR
jgi:hypothetical protein